MPTLKSRRTGQDLRDHPIVLAVAARRARRILYDHKTHALAEHFLEDGPRGHDFDQRADALAQHIQEALESWITDNPPEDIRDA